MSQPTTCPRCGASLPSGTSLDDCPRCLLAAGLPATGSGAVGFDDPAPAELAPLFPELEILEVIGRGGMGVVYRVRQKGLDRAAALKILPKALHEDPAFAERFGREARTMAHLDHPHIVRVHDFGEREGRFFLLMELVDGPSLRQVIDQGGLAPREALLIVPQVCEALQYAHDRGVVHRDVKPGNVLLDRDGHVKITDFGLAKLVTPSEHEHTLTRAGQVMGTPRYMAPEQMLTPDDVDHRADIYSLGVVFYEMLTGDLPMGRFDPPSHKVQVDVRLDEVVLRTLEREREQRYQRADDIRTQVTSIAAAPAPDVAPTPRPAARVTPSPPRLSRLAVWGFLLAMAPLVLLPLVWLLPSGHEGITPVFQYAPVLFLTSWVLGFFLSLFGWIRIASSNGRLRGLGFAIPGVALSVLGGFAALTLGAFLLVRQAEEPPPSGAPIVALTPEEALALDFERPAREIAAMWDDLEKTLRRPKLVPSDFDPFVAEIDRRRIDLARPEDRARWLEDEVLGLAYTRLGALAEGGTQLSLTRLYADDLPMADIELRNGYEVARSRVIKAANDGPWRFAIAPVSRGEESRATWSMPDLIKTDVPMTLDDRRMVQTQIEILWSIFQHSGPDLSAADRSVLLPRGPRRWPDEGEGQDGDFGLLFLDADRLAHSTANYQIHLIRLPTARSAWVTVATQGQRLQFRLTRVDARWWFSLDPVKIEDVEEE